MAVEQIGGAGIRTVPRVDVRDACGEAVLVWGVGDVPLGGNAINVHLSEDCEGIRIVKRLLSYGSKAVVGDVITGDMPEHFAAEGGKTNSSP